MGRDIDILCNHFSVLSEDDILKYKYGESFFFLSIEEEKNHYKSSFTHCANLAIVELKKLELNDPDRYTKELDRIGRVFKHVKEVILPACKPTSVKKEAIIFIIEKVSKEILGTGMAPINIRGFKPKDRGAHRLNYIKFHKALVKNKYLAHTEDGPKLLNAMLNGKKMDQPINWLKNRNHLNYILEALKVSIIDEDRDSLVFKATNIFTYSNERISASQLEDDDRMKNRPKGDKEQLIQNILGELCMTMNTSEYTPKKSKKK